MQLVQKAGVSLKQLFPQANFFGASDVVVDSCCGQWQHVEPNDLYVAIVRPDEDGHAAVHEALARGARYVLAERFLAVDCPVCVVPDSRAAYAVLSQALAGNPTRTTRTLGVTGSQGKTVVCHLLASIIETAGGSPGLLSSLAANDPPVAGVGQLPAADFAEQRSPKLEQLTSPAIATRLATSQGQGADHLIVESPSQLLSDQRLAGVELDLAIITNIRREHLEHHGTVHGYHSIKRRLLDLLKPGGLTVLNVDDPAIYRMLDKLELPVLTASMRREADVTGHLIDREPAEQSFLLQAGNESIPVRTSMIGDGHLQNCLCAAAAGLALGIDLPTIARGLEAVGHLPGRLERIECGQSFSTFVDIGSTPSQLASALHTLKQVVPGRLWCVASAESEASAQTRQKYGKAMEKLADYAVATSPTTHCQPLESFHQMIDGCQQADALHVINNRLTAIEYVLGQARPGDGVLISGAGDQPIAEIGEQKWQITDRDACQSWFYEQPASNDLFQPTAVSHPLQSEIYHIDNYRRRN